MQTNFHIRRVPEKKREKGAKILFEGIVAENLLNLGKETNILIQEAWGVSNR